jgi:PAS domain S-box-containing protein
MWSETVKLLVNFWEADLGGFAERSNGAVVMRDLTFSRGLSKQPDFVSVVQADIIEVLDSGFLTWRLISSPEPVVVAFLPVTRKNRVTGVLLAGHRASGLLPKNLLNTYLALAGLVGTTAERLASDTELKKYRRHLEELVEERTAQLTKTNERLQREITQRQLAEEVLKVQRDALRESEEKYRLLFDNAEVGMFRTSPDGSDVLDMNEKFLKIFKCTAEEMQCNPLSAHWVNPSEWEEMIRRLNCDGRVTDYEFKMLDKQGEVRACVTSLRLYHDQGILEGSIADITERKLAEEALLEARDNLEARVKERTEELVKANSELEAQIAQRKKAEAGLKQTLEDLTRSNEDLQQFAYVTSHDLQEPLRNIVSCLRLLEKKYKNQMNAEADQYIHYSVDSALRMKALILDLLAYSRVATKGKSAEPTDCERMLDTVLDNLNSAMNETGAIITRDTLPTIRADETQLTQVFQNLIQNAVKFRRAESPKVHVSAVKNENGWIFSVKDNGIGIESQYLEKIFVIFQRLNKRTEYEGTGMGLAIVKKVVERHGGRIWVKSEPGKGTTFYFTIPETEILM